MRSELFIEDRYLLVTNRLKQFAYLSKFSGGRFDHGIVAPHVLKYFFENVDGRRELLAEAFGVGDRPDTAAAIVESVEQVRNALGLPEQLRDVNGPDPAEFPEVAETIRTDSFMANAPRGLDPTTEEIEAVLENAY